MDELEYVSTSVEVDGDLVAFTHEWRGDLQWRGTVLWSVVVRDPASGETRQVGYKLVDDEDAAQFVFDHTGRPMQTNFEFDRTLEHDVTVGREGGRVVARFPVAALPDLGAGTTYSWTINVDGEDVVTAQS